MEPVHFSSLKHMARSPAHYLYAATKTIEPSRAMRIGTAVHSRVLGGDPVAVYLGTRRGKAWDEFEAEHEGQTILNEAESIEVEAVAQAVLASPHISLIHGTDKEVPVAWKYLDRECSSRLDVVAASYILDLKTSATSEPGRFTRKAVWDYHYHAQLAFYNLALGRRAESPAYIIAVESTPPYPVTCLRLTDRALAAGEKCCRIWMERVLACEAQGEWPGYVQDVVDLDVPDMEDLQLTIDGEEVEL